MNPVVKIDRELDNLLDLMSHEEIIEFTRKEERIGNMLDIPSAGFALSFLGFRSKVKLLDKLKARKKGAMVHEVLAEFGVVETVTNSFGDLVKFATLENGDVFSCIIFGPWRLEIAYRSNETGSLVYCFDEWTNDNVLTISDEDELRFHLERLTGDN